MITITKKDAIMGLIIILLLAYILYPKSKIDGSTIESNKNKIDSIGKINDSIKLVNNELRYRISQIDNRIAIYNELLKNNQNEINKLKAETQEKVTEVDNLSYQELVEFFNKRYPE